MQNKSFVPSVSSVCSYAGVAVTPHHLASQAAVEVMNAGGNAIDGAMAGALALGVVTPYHSGIGGSGFIVLHSSAGENIVIDARGPAPAGAHRDMFVLNGKPDTKMSLHTLAAVAVPSLLKGIQTSVERWGNGVGWQTIFAPAIRVARQGFRLDHRYVKKAHFHHTEMERFPETKRVYGTIVGNPVAPNDLLALPELADTYQHLAEHGPDDFYTGQLAHTITDYCQQQGGLLSPQDLASYAPRIVPPLRIDYRGLQVYSMPPPSVGGIVLAQALNLLEPFTPGQPPYQLQTSQSLHLLCEALRNAYADTMEHVGDPRFTNIPVEHLTSKPYTEQLRTRIRLDRAGCSTPRPAPAPNAHGTSHLSVIDHAGNCVAMTTTLNTWFGCVATVPGAGIVLNNDMDDFAIQPGTPNYFGLVGTEANAIAPGKCPQSCMTPTIVLTSDGTPRIIIGGAGGSEIPTATLQVLLNVLDFGLSPSEAVAVPRVHHQWLPDRIVADQTLPENLVTELQSMGHTTHSKERESAVQVITVDPATGLRVGAGDPSGAGSAAATHPAP